MRGSSFHGAIDQCGDCVCATGLAKLAEWLDCAVPPDRLESAGVNGYVVPHVDVYAKVTLLSREHPLLPTHN